jgi:hypothetical protein
VLDTTYPTTFASVLEWFKPFRDIFGIFFSAECAGFGGFENKWKLRVVAMPLTLFLMMNLEYALAWLTAVMTGRAHDWDGPSLGVNAPQQRTPSTGESLRDRASARYISRGLLCIFLT